MRQTLAKILEKKRICVIDGSMGTALGIWAPISKLPVDSTCALGSARISKKGPIWIISMPARTRALPAAIRPPFLDSWQMAFRKKPRISLSVQSRSSKEARNEWWEKRQGRGPRLSHVSSWHRALWRFIWLMARNIAPLRHS